MELDAEYVVNRVHGRGADAQPDRRQSPRIGATQQLRRTALGPGADHEQDVTGTGEEPQRADRIGIVDRHGRDCGPRVRPSHPPTIG